MSTLIRTTTQVTVTGISEAHPPILGVVVEGRRPIVRWIPVRDQHLSQNLRRQVRPGDRIRIHMATEFLENGGYETYLTDFEKGNDTTG